MANLFAKAKKAAPEKVTKAKEEKTRIRVSDENFFENVQKAEILQDRMKSDKAKLEIISDELREIGRSKWIERYESDGKNPGSVMIEGVNEDNEDVAQFMFVPSDKYITINEARADELRESYGEAIVEEKTVFSFDAAMIEKYGEILSRLIEECDEIATKDKEKIVVATNSFSVAKGTIDLFTKYGDGDVTEMVESTRPVVSLKGIEVIKG